PARYDEGVGETPQAQIEESFSRSRNLPSPFLPPYSRPSSTERPRIRARGHPVPRFEPDGGLLPSETRFPSPGQRGGASGPHRLSALARANAGPRRQVPRARPWPRPGSG